MAPLFKKSVGLLGKLVVAFLIAGVTGEVACRLLGLGSGIIYPRGLYTTSDDAEIAVEFTPGFTGRAYGQPVRINALGFRGPEIEIAPPPGTYRVLCVGDSFTYGMGVREEEAWPAVVARWLEPPPGFERVEVTNTGVPGYNLWQGMAVIRRWQPRLQPHAIVFALVSNDLEPAFYVEDGYLRVPGRTYGWSFPGKRWLQTRSHLYQFVSMKVTHLLAARVGYDEVAVPRDPELRHAYRTARERGVRALADLTAELAAVPVRLVVADIDIQPDSLIAGLIEEAGAPHYAIELVPGETLIDGHPDVAGHERIARQIVAALESRW